MYVDTLENFASPHREEEEVKVFQQDGAHPPLVTLYDVLQMNISQVTG
jgi:hypothetical protein